MEARNSLIGMKQKLLPAFSAMVLLLTACKKNVTEETETIPDSGIYVSTQFTETSLRISPNIIYSTRPNFRNNQYTSITTKTAEMASNTLQLKMDLAIPPNATAANPQPLIVFIHGGGFVTGDKSDLYEDALSYARAGYVVASINYRLTQNQANDSMRLLSRQHALEDVFNAIRFLKTNSQTYFIDITRTLTLGSSAGGGLSLFNALDPDLSYAINDYPGFSSRVKGAISTGATLRLDDLNGLTPSYDASDAPVLLFHANPVDGGTGATWQDALTTQSRINAAGNQCTVTAQPDMTHTVSLALGGNYWSSLKPFIWKTLDLKNK